MSKENNPSECTTRGSAAQFYATRCVTNSGTAYFASALVNNDFIARSNGEVHAKFCDCPGSLSPNTPITRNFGFLNREG
jgi:hypothetical protein